MNRADLSYQLRACIPHAGGRKWPNVGLYAAMGELWVWAANPYTVCVTRRPSETVLQAVELSAKEAGDLARWVRPQLKDDEAQPVTFAVRDAELHVLAEGRTVTVKGEGRVLEETSVFELSPSDDDTFSLDALCNHIDHLFNLPVDSRPSVYNPSLYESFSQAKRLEGDRMTVWARRAHGSAKIGVGVVVVGDSCIGAVAGMEDVPAFDALSALLYGQEGAA